MSPAKANVRRVFRKLISEALSTFNLTPTQQKECLGARIYCDPLSGGGFKAKWFYLVQKNTAETLVRAINSAPVTIDGITYKAHYVPIFHYVSGRRGFNVCLRAQAQAASDQDTYVSHLSLIHI